MAKLRELFGGTRLLVIGGVLVATALPVFVGYLKISNTYDDFQSEVFSCAWTYAFLLALVVVTWLLVALLGFLVGPNWWAPFAVLVAAVVGILVSSPLAFAPLRGADAPGHGERHLLVNLPGPLEQLLTDRLDEVVRRAQARETAVLVDEYVGRGKRGKRELLRRLDRSLRAPDDDLSRGQRRRVKAGVRSILTTGKVGYDTRLLRIARMLYEAGLRDAVVKLAA
ncbi:MAG TPA: hypothetical protein VF526_14080 [Solirubrobacteraceae bacterium]